MRTEILTTDEAFLALQPAWEELLDRVSNASVFTTWEWVSTWWGCFGSGYRLAVITVYESRPGLPDRLVGIAPFVISRGLKRTLRVIANPLVASDHIDLIIQDGYESAVGQAVGEGLLALRNEWTLARLDAVHAGGILADVAGLAGRHSRTYRWPVTAPYLRLPESWDAFLTQRSRNFRYTLSRHHRKLTKDFPDRVVFTEICDRARLPKAMQRLFALHQAVKKAGGLRGAFDDVRKQRFHCDLAAALLQRGWLRLYELSVDDEVIASIYCFRYRDTVAFYQTGYALDWSKYRPGQQVMAHALRSAIEEGAKVFDFLRGDEGYKRHWTDTYAVDENLMVPNGWLGSIHVELFRLAKAALRLRRRLGDARSST